MKTLIFETPKLSPLPNRVGWGLFTAFFWLLWIYLWAPLLTLLLWSFGFTSIYQYFLDISESDLIDFKHLITFYAIVVGILAASLLVWAGSDFLRFRHNHQRRRPPLVEIKELAEFAEIPLQTMVELGSVQRMIAHHDERGKFLYAEIG